MRVLMVGAGAVGVVLTRCLEAQKTNEVTYYVRPGRKAQLARTKLVDAKSGELQVRERPAVVEPGDRLPGVDTVVLAVRGDQVDAALDLVATLGEVRIASAAAGADGLERIHARFPGRPVVQLVPMFLGYPDADAIRWWNPPLARTLIVHDDPGSRAFADELARDLKAGGLPVRVTGDIRDHYDALTAAGVPLLASLELAGWDVRALAGDPALRRLAVRGVREGACAAAGRSPLKRLIAWTPGTLISTALRLAPSLMSRDTQEMWRVHGPKIAGQTREQFGALLARAGDGGAGLRQLQARLDVHLLDGRR
jgi:ketopantoate reductase